MPGHSRSGDLRIPNAAVEAAIESQCPLATAALSMSGMKRYLRDRWFVEERDAKPMCFGVHSAEQVSPYRENAQMVFVLPRVESEELTWTLAGFGPLTEWHVKEVKRKGSPRDPAIEVRLHAFPKPVPETNDLGSPAVPLVGTFSTGGVIVKAKSGDER